jgi:hypothetical protein
VCLGVVPAAQAAPASVGFTGNAYGTAATVGGLVVSGPTAPVGLGCLTPAGANLSNTLATVAVPGLVNAGAIDTTATTFENATSAGDTTTATIGAVNLLNGAIKVNAIKASSSTTKTAAGVAVSPNDSGIAGLVINGKQVLNLHPNLTIPVPGIGRVVVDEQQKVVTANSVSFTVNALDIVITATNIKGVATGTRIIVGHAMSGLTLPNGTPPPLIAGDAYSTAVNVAGLVRSGPTFPIGLGLACGGGNGQLITDEALGVHVGKLLTTGTLENTSQGLVTGNSAVGELTSTVQNVNLLGGLIKVGAIKADVRAAVSSTGVSSFNDNGSTIAGLVIAGHPVSLDVSANTKINLGLLTIWLHRVVRTPNSMSVRMLEVTGTPPAKTGIRSNVDIRVAVAEAST